MQKPSFLNLERKDWQITITLLIAMLLVIMAHYFAGNVLDEHQHSSAIITASFEGNNLLNNLDHHLVELESEVRNFVILADEKYAVTTEEVIKKTRADIVAVRNHFANTVQPIQLERLEELVSEKIRFSKNVIDNFRADGPIATTKMFGSQDGFMLRENIIAITDSLRNSHREHIVAYLNQKSNASDWLRRLSSASVLIVLLITMVSIFYLAKTAQRRNQAEQGKAQKQQELTQSLTFIKDLYENAPIGFHSFNSEGVIIEMNETELEWLGYEREAVVGKMKLSDITAMTAANYEAFIAQLTKTGKLDNIEGQLIRKDGSLMPCISNSRVVYDEQGKMQYTRIALMDFTEQKKLQDELKIAREIAEQSGVLKEQFVANMSHEIRTPLNAILGFSSLLQRTDLKENQKEFAQSIQTSSENLLTIINDVLDFSKIAAGVIRMERIPFSLSSLLHSVENMFRYRADEKQLQFEMEVDENLPEAVQGDPTRLTQILVNLLSNALKFTNSGSVKLLASQVKQENGHATVRFTVSDTGIGIPLDKQAFIFERFGQASTDTTRRFGGAGLGLTISKQLVELQGGQIWVESEEGNGAAFMVEIPYDIAETVIGNGKSPSSRFKNQQGSILIVEDNMMNSRIVGLLLDDWGFGYDHAENGKIALEKLSHHVYDLILMDIQMPVMDGYTTSQYIRQQLHLKVPIIATTAHAFAGEREKCISYGMNDYISKPIKEEELIALISRYVRRKKQNKSMHMGSPASAKAAAGFDRQYIFDISKGKPEVLREMVDLFISQSTKEVAQMEKALQSNNFGEAAAAAHSMKSTAAYMGFAETFDELLSTFEQEAKGQTPNPAVVQRLFATIKTNLGTVKQFLETSFFEEWASRA
ncbi:MAG: response regulator [Saprospiraceae bacterium]